MIYSTMEIMTTERDIENVEAVCHIIFEPKSDQLDEHLDNENPGENIVVELQLTGILL